MKKELIRCPWVSTDQVYIDYHDKEWGKPQHDDDHLFEMLILEGFQAGLSWLTVLKKRENFRKAFDNFDAKKIAKYTDKKIESLMANEGIIRNRLKIQSTIQNAHAFLEIKKNDSFSNYLWNFTNHKILRNYPATLKDYLSRSVESDNMSKALKKAGFNFVGTTICYAFMQAVGMVNDHSKDCFCTTTKTEK